jgi:sporulation protein YlmC with PRC-barrel domain
MSTQERPQIAWKAIEANTPVFSSEGEAVGTVSQVVGDPDADVFTGLAISLGALGADRFVESERVRGIWPDRIDVALTKAEMENLPVYEESPSVRWRPGRGGFFSRLFGGR